MINQQFNDESLKLLFRDTADLLNKTNSKINNLWYAILALVSIILGFALAAIIILL